MKQEIKFETTFEVTKNQYHALMTHCGGIVAGRKEGEKYFIQVWLMKYVKYVYQILETVK